MATHAAQYILRIMQADVYAERLDRDYLSEIINDVEQQISDDLPEGYYCKIDDA